MMANLRAILTASIITVLIQAIITETSFSQNNGKNIVPAILNISEEIKDKYVISLSNFVPADLNRNHVEDLANLVISTSMVTAVDGRSIITSYDPFADLFAFIKNENKAAEVVFVNGALLDRLVTKGEVPHSDNPFTLTLVERPFLQNTITKLLKTGASWDDLIATSQTPENKATVLSGLSVQVKGLDAIGNATCVTSLEKKLEQPSTEILSKIKKQDIAYMQMKSVVINENEEIFVLQDHVLARYFLVVSLAKKQGCAIINFKYLVSDSFQ